MIPICRTAALSGRSHGPPARQRTTRAAGIARIGSRSTPTIGGTAPKCALGIANPSKPHPSTVCPGLTRQRELLVGQAVSMLACGAPFGLAHASRRIPKEHTCVPLSLASPSRDVKPSERLGCNRSRHRGAQDNGERVAVLAPPILCFAVMRGRGTHQRNRRRQSSVGRRSRRFCANHVGAGISMRDMSSCFRFGPVTLTWT